MSDRERVSDERLREIGDEQKLTWGGLEEYWDLAVDLLDARDRIARLEDSLNRAANLASVLAELDRCDHGRHEGDICSGTKGCNGPSEGNPRFKTGDRIGTSMLGRPIVMPPRGRRDDPAAWYDLSGESGV
jgi:hypothetical protein